MWAATRPFKPPMHTAPPIEPAATAPSPRRSWLEATSQQAKLRPLSLAALWILAAWWLGKLAGALELPPYASEAIAAAGVMLFGACILYPVVAITCQKCHGRALAHFLRHSPFHCWLSDLRSATSCPRCGDDGHGSATRS